ncbi:hypothetical protein PZA11_007667 [Diplocarpon coronariae]
MVNSRYPTSFAICHIPSAGRSQRNTPNRIDLLETPEHASQYYQQSLHHLLPLLLWLQIIPVLLLWLQICSYPAHIFRALAQVERARHFFSLILGILRFRKIILSGAPTRCRRSQSKWMTGA